MFLTNDQYVGLSMLDKWWRKYSHQFIEISGCVGTGIWEVIQRFIDEQNIDPREVMYLSYDQKQVLELAYKRFHAYHLPNRIYNFNRLLDFNSLPVINQHSVAIDYTWEKEVKKKIDSRYKLIVVFDSVLLSEEVINDLSTFGRPVILIRDPMLLPSPDSMTFLRKPNIKLKEIHPEYAKNPIIHFAHKVLRRERINPGNYDIVSVVPQKQMNLYNLRSCDMVLTISDGLRTSINQIYREKIMKGSSESTLVNERLIAMDNMYAHHITNPDEKKVKIYLAKGTVGKISKINKHAATTRWVPCEFRAEFYHEPFTDLMIDRNYLNGVSTPSRQIIPDEIFRAEYAYALTPSLARLSHWDKITMIADENELADDELQKRMLYTAITRARKLLTILI